MGDRLKSQSSWKAIAAISAGNAFEWFDFIVFGYFTASIAKNFFPAHDAQLSFLLTLGIFGAAFVMRPLGAFTFGFYADRRGRKPALLLTVSLMAIGTTLIALAPTPAVVGPVAPYIVLVGRLLQGLSAGGEFGSATALLAEQNAVHRGFLSSLQFAGQALALVLATLFGAILTTQLTSDEIDNWGWRIPFLIGAMLAPLVLYLRAQIFESDAFKSNRSSQANAQELWSSRYSFLLSFGLVTVATVTVYTLVFMPAYAVSYLGYSRADTLVVSCCTGILQFVLIPIAGAISDKLGHRRIAALANVGIFLTVVPLVYWLVAQPTFATLLIVQFLIGGQLALYLGALPAMMTELFPARVRTRGLSVSYAVGVAVFGGFAPVINALIIDLSRNEAALSYYVAAAAALSLLANYGVWRGHSFEVGLRKRQDDN